MREENIHEHAIQNIWSKLERENDFMVSKIEKFRDKEYFHAFVEENMPFITPVQHNLGNGHDNMQNVPLIKELLKKMMYLLKYSIHTNLMMGKFVIYVLVPILEIILSGDKKFLICISSCTMMIFQWSDKAPMPIATSKQHSTLLWVTLTQQWDLSCTAFNSQFFVEQTNKRLRFWHRNAPTTWRLGHARGRGHHCHISWWQNELQGILSVGNIR